MRDLLRRRGGEGVTKLFPCRGCVIGDDVVAGAETNVLGEDGNDDPSPQRHVGFFEASSHLISRRAGSGEPSAGLKVGRKYTPTVKSLKRPSVVKVTQCLLFS